MKKISIVFSCVLVLSMLFLISTTAASNIEIDYSYYDTSSVDFSLTEEDNFIPDSLTIVLKKQYSGGFKRWDKFDFARIKNFDYELDDLTADTSVYSEAIEKKVFRKIIRIDLPGFTKRTVIELGKLLQKLDFVYSVSPNVPLYVPDDAITPIEETVSIINDVAEVLDDTQTSLPVLSTNDPFLTNQYALIDTGIRKAWNYTAGFTSDPVYVGVLDFGVSAHPDLAENVVQGYDFINNTPTYYGLCEGSYFNHGTGVAGVIGAVGNNGVGISGVNMRVKIVPLVANYSDQYVNAINYAARQNIKIINSSMLFDYPIDSFEQAIDNYKGLLICCAGNNGENLDISPSYPSCYNAENIISVGATKEDKTPRTSTNYSTTHVDLMAPGENIYTTHLDDDRNYGYAYWHGTSLSSPLVAGVASLLLSYNPGLTSAQLKHYILSTVTTSTALTSYCVTGGILNALAAIQAVPQRGQVKNVLVPVKVTNNRIRQTIFYFNYNPLIENYVDNVIPSGASGRYNYNTITANPRTKRFLVNCITNDADDTIDLNTPFIYLKFNTQYDFPSVRSSFSYTKTRTIPTAAHESLTLDITPYLLGDVDGTNTIVANDALLILQHANGKSSLPSSALINADVNMDGQINAVDAQLTLQYTTEKLASFW